MGKYQTVCTAIKLECNRDKNEIQRKSEFESTAKLRCLSLSYHGCAEVLSTKYHILYRCIHAHVLECVYFICLPQSCESLRLTALSLANLSLVQMLKPLLSTRPCDPRPHAVIGRSSPGCQTCDRRFVSPVPSDWPTIVMLWPWSKKQVVKVNALPCGNVNMLPA